MRTLSFLVALLAVVLAGPASAVQVIEAVKPVQVQTADVDVEIAEFGPVFIAYTSNTGPYDTVGKAIGSFMQHLGKQKIKPVGPLMCIYYDDPAATPANELRWDIAMEVAEGTKVAAPLKTKVIERCLVARTAFRGMPEKLGPVYAGLTREAVARGYRTVGPAIELHTGMPTGRMMNCTINFAVAAPEEPGPGEPRPEEPRPDEPRPEEREPGGIEAELVIPEPMLLVFTEHTGPFEQIGPATEAFERELEAQGVEPAGPLMHIFLGGLEGEAKGELRWRVAIPIHGEREVAEPLMIHGVPERVVARTVFFGPPGEHIHELFGGLMDYAHRRGYLPVGPPAIAYPPIEGPERPEHEMPPDEAHGDPIEGIAPPEREPMGRPLVLTVPVEKVPPVETEIVIMGPHPMVSMWHEGPFELLNEATGAFMAELEKQGIEPMGPCTRVYMTEPEGGPEQPPHCELRVPIPEEREVAEPLMLKMFPECACARAFYEGPKGGVRMAHEMMVHQMAERGWRPAGPLMQTIFEADEGHVACVLRFVVAKGEGEPGPEGGGLHEGHVTFNVNGANVRDFCKWFAERLEINIIVEPDVDGPINASLTDVPWEVALRETLESHGFVLTVSDDGIYRVSTGE